MATLQWTLAVTGGVCDPEYGEIEYGECEYGEDLASEFATGANVLWLYINRDVPRIAGLGDLLDFRLSKFISIVSQIIGGFNIDTAQGVALDILGAGLGLPRMGFSDADYRRALKVQRNLILSSAGTRPVLIEIWTQWTGAAPLHYRDAPNYIEIGGVVAVADEPALLAFLEQAAPGGRTVNAYTYESDYLVGDYAQDPLTTPGTTDYEQDPVTGAALTSGRLYQ